MPKRNLLQQIEHDTALFQQLPKAEQESLKREFSQIRSWPGIHFPATKEATNEPPRH